MKLFYTPSSPYARKVRVALRELNLLGRFDEVIVNPYEDDPRLLAVNPAGLVPAMTAEDGQPLMDSPLLLQFINTQGGGALMPDDPKEAWAVLTEAAIADAILDFALDAVHEKRRNDVPPSSAFLVRKLAKISNCVDRLPRKSTVVRTIHLGDIATACALAYLDLRHPELDWRKARPDLVDWHNVIETRPAFLDTKPMERAA